jgi:molybdenum cofactor guanylyltransferase
MATIILAGGASARMGKDKASLCANGTTLVQALVSKFRLELPPVIVALRQGQDLPMSDAEIVHDSIHGRGPLGGLHAGLIASPDDVNFALACDLPLADVALAKYLLNRADGYDAVVPRLDRGIEPLFAVYRKNCIPEIVSTLETGDGRIRGLLDRVNTLCVDDGEIRRYDPELRSFLNVNTPEDYAEYLVLLAEGPADEARGFYG